MESFQKQPSDILAYDVDFTLWFAQILADYIATATCTVVSASNGNTAGLTVQSVSIIGAPDGKPRIAKIWIAGGLNAVTYELTLKVETHEGRHKEVDFKIKVKET